MSSFPCATCGGVLPDLPYRRMITCPYCSKEEPNRGCFRIDEEVLVPGDFGLVLGRIAKCEGPDAITVGDKNFHFSAVIPVIRPPADLESGTHVYRSGLLKWSLTYTAGRAAGGTVKVKVKHADPSFSAPLFDEEESLSEIRLDARSEELGGVPRRRVGFDAFIRRVRTIGSFGVKSVFTVIMVIVGIAVLRMVLFD